MVFKSDEIVPITIFQYRLKENIQKALEIGRLIIFRRNELAFIVIPIKENEVVEDIKHTITSFDFQKNMKKNAEKLKETGSMVVIKENKPYFIICTEPNYEKSKRKICVNSEK